DKKGPLLSRKHAPLMRMKLCLQLADDKRELFKAH
ncbi:unnamed protein product, partial [Onchocerca ochengi]